jgi:hypothetical protein
MPHPRIVRRLHLQIDTHGRLTVTHPSTGEVVTLPAAALSVLCAIGANADDTLDAWAKENLSDSEDLSRWIAALEEAGLVATSAAIGERAGMKERSAWPIFVLGPHRSGTTLLRWILDAHPRIACPPETKFLRPLERLMRYPQAVEGLRGLGLTESEALCELRRLVDSIMGGYAARRHKARWAEKTPNYYLILDFIDALFEGRVLYVWAVRHPLDCAHSMHESYGRHTSHRDVDLRRVERLHGAGKGAWVRYWLEATSRILEFCAGRPSRCHRVKYEELVASPHEVVARMLEFLGEEPDADLVARTFRVSHDRGFGDPKIYRSNTIESDRIGRWRRWTEEEIAFYGEIVGPLARQLGYGEP